MSNSKKSSGGDKSRKRKPAVTRRKSTGTARKQTRSKKPAARKPILPKQGLIGDIEPKIILAKDTPPTLVGPSLPFDIEDPRLQGVDPDVLQQWYADNLQVHEYPDPATIEVDEHGFVVGFAVPDEDRHYHLREHEGHIVVPQEVLHGLVTTNLPDLLKSGSSPSRDVLKSLTGLKTAKKDGSHFKVPSALLRQLLDITVPDPLGAKGGKGKGKGGGGHKPLPSPQLVEQIVDQGFAGVAEVGYNDNLVVELQNGEFLNASKANFYLNSWVKIAKRAHITMWVECDGAALSVIGKAAGYGHFCCKPNSRGQGVGFTIHPRLRLLAQPETIWAIANVGNTPDLRPGYRLYLEDKTTGLKFYAEVLHTKSMRGGPAQTAPTRYKQFEETVKGNAGLTDPILVGGDMNCFLNNTTDTLPLTQAGYKLVYPNDSTSTQAMGGRLDGLFQLSFVQKIGRYQIFNWWKNKQIGRAFTDHGCCRFTIYNTGGPAPTEGSDDKGDEVVVQ